MVLASTQSFSLFNHGGTNKGSWELGAYAVGVPHPAFSYGYNNLAITRPADPSDWPLSEDSNGLFYYIDSQHPSATDTANTYGYPNQPRATIPEGSFSAGTVMIIVGGSGYPAYTIAGDSRWTMTMPGTIPSKCFVVGEGDEKPKLNKEFRLTGSSHVIFYNIEFSRPDGVSFAVNGINAISDVSSYITVRECTLSGDGVDYGNKSAISNQGYDADNINQYVTLFNNLIKDYGENNASATENDFHAFKPEQDAAYIWYIGNTSRNLGGDCIQVGSATTPDANRCKYVWIAKNDMSNTFENAVDIKNCQYIVVSDNDMYNFERVNTTASNTFLASVTHDNGDSVYFINNRVRQCGMGFNCTGITDMWYVGNIIYDTAAVDTGGYDGDTAFGDTACIQFRGGSSTGGILHNTFYDFSKGIQTANDPSVAILNNVITGRNRSDGHSLMFADASGYTNAIIDNNCYYEPTHAVSFDRGTTTENLSTFQTNTGLEANAVSADPLLVNPASQDFNLQSGSPCRNAGTANVFVPGTSTTVYQQFLTNFSGIAAGGYSLAINIDQNGITRDSSPDIGALEYVA